METKNLIGNKYQPQSGNKFHGFNPALGVDLPGDFYPASLKEVDEAMSLANKAFAVYKNIDRNKKAAFLRGIADEIKALNEEIVERAMAESGLPQPRLQGEFNRTVNQLYMFAGL